MENPLKVSLENIIPLTEARDHFSQIVNEVQKDKLYVLTKGGKPAVAIVDVKYLEHITGGEIKKEQVQEEIKKYPEKVGLPPMVEHSLPKPPPPPSPAPIKSEPPVKPAPPIQSEPTNPPKPAGFAAPQPPKPQTPLPPAPKPQAPPAPPMPKPQPNQDLKNQPPIKQDAALPENKPAPAVGQNDLKSTNTDAEKINIQFNQPDDAPQDKTSNKNNSIPLDDQTPPAQYAGDDTEPQDMSID